jgi:predicted transcriptional regulator
MSSAPAEKRTGQRADRELLARLRNERAAVVKSATEENRLRRAARKKIRAELANGPATVPAIASATGLKSSDVLWHVAAMRKYGQLVEDQKAGDYFTYRLVDGGGESEGED